MLIQVLQRRLRIYRCLLACIPALIFSCSKSDKSDNPDPIPGYYVKFKADGKEYVIKDQQTIGSVTAKFSGTKVFSAGGIAIPGPDPAMNFVLKSNEDITPKEYKAAGESNKYPDISIHYTLPVADPVKKYESADFSAGITVTITEITKESVKGTFTANLNHQIRADRPAITDGEFFGKRTD